MKHLGCAEFLEKRDVFASFFFSTQTSEVVKIEKQDEQKQDEHSLIKDDISHEKKKVETVTFKKETLWKGATVVLGLLLVIGVFNGGFSFGKNSPTGAAVVAAPSGNIDMKVLVDDDPFLGDDNAPVVIIEFSDYECPFCARFYSQTLSQIKSKYIDTGKVKFVYRDFPLSFHPQAIPAALAANCAGEQGKYFEYHDKIFTNGGSAGKSDGDYKRWAQELGLNVAEWETCRKDPKQAAEIQKDFRDGGAAGVTGTPGFIINGQLLSGAQPFNVFQQIIESELN